MAGHDKPNHKVWVKNWSQITRDCEARLKFIEKTLNIEVSADEISERIEHLKSSILKVEEDLLVDASSGAGNRAAELPLQAGKPAEPAPSP